MQASAVAIEDQLCFQLYATARAITGSYREGLAALGLTYPQYITLLVLWQQDGRKVSEISEALELDSGTVSPILQRLEADGLITRTRDISDARSVSIHLTDAGKALEEKVVPIREDVECSTGLNETQFAEIKAALVKLREALLVSEA